MRPDSCRAGYRSLSETRSRVALCQPTAAPRCPQGLARSVDGGPTWGSVGPPAQSGGVVALADGTFLALQLPVRARGNAAGYIYRWSRPWSPKTHTFPTDVAVIAFAGVAATHTLLLSDIGRVYRSTDGGTTWNRSTTGLPDGKAVWTLLAPPDRSTVYAGTDGGVYASADDGHTWRATSS